MSSQLGQKWYPKIKVFKQSDILALPPTHTNGEPEFIPTPEAFTSSTSSFVITSLFTSYRMRNCPQDQDLGLTDDLQDITLTIALGNDTTTGFPSRLQVDLLDVDDNILATKVVPNTTPVSNIIVTFNLPADLNDGITNQAVRTLRIDATQFDQVILINSATGPTPTFTITGNKLVMGPNPDYILFPYPEDPTKAVSSYQFGYGETTTVTTETVTFPQDQIVFSDAQGMTGSAFYRLNNTDNTNVRSLTLTVNNTTKFNGTNQGRITIYKEAIGPNSVILSNVDFGVSGGNTASNLTDGTNFVFLGSTSTFIFDENATIVLTGQVDTVAGSPITLPVNSFVFNSSNELQLPLTQNLGTLTNDLTTLVLKITPTVNSSTLDSTVSILDINDNVLVEQTGVRYGVAGGVSFSNIPAGAAKVRLSGGSYSATNTPSVTMVGYDGETTTSTVTYTPTSDILEPAKYLTIPFTQDLGISSNSVLNSLDFRLIGTDTNEANGSIKILDEDDNVLVQQLNVSYDNADGFSFTNIPLGASKLRLEGGYYSNLSVSTLANLTGSVTTTITGPTVAGADLEVTNCTVTRGINTNVGSASVIIKNARDFISNGDIELGYNELIEISFSKNIIETDVNVPVVWFRGYIQSVKYVKINAQQDDLILQAVGEGVVLRERLTKITRIRPYGKITRINEATGLHFEQLGFLDDLYQDTKTFDTNNPTIAGITQYFQFGGFNFDPRTRVLNTTVSAKDKLPVSITRFPFQTNINSIIDDMFGVIPNTIPSGSQDYINPLVKPNQTHNLLRIFDEGDGVENLSIVLPEFKSDYGTIISAIDTLAADTNSIYYLDNEGKFHFRQTPLSSGKIMNANTDLYTSYSFNEDILTNGFSSITGLGFQPQEFNIFAEFDTVKFQTTLDRATRWRSAGVPDSTGDINVNSFRRSNNIGILFKTGDNIDISSIELPLIRITGVTSALQWEIREYTDGDITANYDSSGKDSELILDTGVITATQLNEIVPYLYETWSDSDSDTSGDRNPEINDTTFAAPNANNATTADQVSLVELPIVTNKLRPNTEFMLVIRPPIDINGLPVNGNPSVQSTNGVIDNLLFVYSSGDAQATANTPDSSNVIDEITVINSGRFYSSSPTVTLVKDSNDTGTITQTAVFDVTINTNGEVTDIDVTTTGIGYTLKPTVLISESPTPVESKSNLRRWATTPAGITGPSGGVYSFSPLGGISVLTNDTNAVVQTLSPLNIDSTLSQQTTGSSDKHTSIPLVLGNIPIRVNVSRSTVITTTNPVLSGVYGLRELTIPFPSNANAEVVKNSILDIQNNLFNKRNRVYSDFTYIFPETILEAGTTINVVDSTTGLDRNLLVSQVTINVNAGQGKPFSDRIMIKGTQLI